MDVFNPEYMNELCVMVEYVVYTNKDLVLNNSAVIQMYIRSVFWFVSVSKHELYC